MALCGPILSSHRCYLKMLREGVYTILSCLQSSTQISLLALKQLLLLVPSPKMWSQLCSSGKLSLQTDEQLQGQQWELHIMTSSFLCRAASPLWCRCTCHTPHPSSLFLPSQCWLQTACCGLTSCCCRVYVYPFLWCLLHLPVVPWFMLKQSKFWSRELKGMEGYVLANEKKKSLTNGFLSV